jgi:hypothetical protein
MDLYMTFVHVQDLIEVLYHQHHYLYVHQQLLYPCWWQLLVMLVLPSRPLSLRASLHHYHYLGWVIDHQGY